MGKSSKEKKEEIKNYFGLIPKEEFSRFIEIFNTVLADTKNKKGEKKYCEFEIKTTKENINDSSLEIYTFDKTKYFEYIIEENENFKDSLFYISLNLEAKEEAEVANIKICFDSFILHINPNFNFNFSSKGKKICYNLFCKNSKDLEAFLNLGIDITKYQKFNLILKSGINLFELFTKQEEINIVFQKIYSIIFTIKSETNNVKYLSTAFIEAMKAIKLDNKILQNKFDKLIGFLNLINSFIRSNLKLELDNKFCSKEIGYLEFLSEFLNFCEIFPKQINFDKISLFIRFPKYQNGIAIFLKIPGLSYAITLDNKEKNLLLKSFEEKIEEEKERRKKKKKK